MDLEPFQGPTDLSRFYNFINQLDQNYIIEIEEQNWGDMCGITLVQRLGNEELRWCFSFYSDGNFRCMINENS